KVDKEEDEDVLFLSTESQPERDKNQDAQRSIQTNILFQEERLERGDNLQIKPDFRANLIQNPRRDAGVLY
ncbi:MAG: hypothetical protein WCO09_02285, partial [bacterium]